MRDSTQPRTVEVAAGLVFRDKQLLITQRPTTGHLANLWEFPGGKREANETFEECLQRELMEELNITVGSLELMESVDHRYPEKTVHLKFYKCQLVEGVPQAIGCQDLCWVTREELSNFQFPDADAQLLDRLNRDLKIWETG